jgi:hypothetical protein
MEPDELKAAWQTLGQRLERQEAIQWHLLRDRKLDNVRSTVRPLFWAQALQAVLGAGLLVLGVACWGRNTDVPGLFATGIALHAFGVVTMVMAFITMSLIGTMDYTAPVLKIQKRFGLLQRFYGINSMVCGAPWWIMWLLVVVGLAGLGPVDPRAGTPPWITWSFFISIAGFVGTVAAVYWHRHRHPRVDRSWEESAGVRRGRTLLQEIAQFEKE